MTTVWKRRLAGICLIISPLAYSEGVMLYHDQFEILSQLVVFGWVVISFAVGYLAAVTFRRQIFGVNCGSVLAYSVGIMVIAFTLQVLEHPAGEWLGNAFLIFSPLYGLLTLWKNRKQTQTDRS